MRLFKETIFQYLLVVFVSFCTSVAVVAADEALRHAGVDEWARGFAAGCAGCLLLVGLTRARRDS